MNIDVILNPAEIDHLHERDLSATTCVVFDVLRATSSMITGIASGVSAFYPVATIEEARELKARMPDAWLGGERHGERIDGFDLGNSPLEYRGLKTGRIITTTTNGTVALRACEKAHHVYAGALLNSTALTRCLAAQNPVELMLVCAGTFREPALEDILAAGLFVNAFSMASLSDAAKSALSVFRRYAHDLYEGLAAARNGRVLLSKGREEEVRWCSGNGVLDVVAVMQSGALVPLL